MSSPASGVASEVYLELEVRDSRVAKREGDVMSPRDGDAEAEIETANETERPAAESTDAEPREQALRHLQAALSAAEPDAKQFHIRQALQLLDIERR